LEGTAKSQLRNNFALNRYFISLYSYSKGNTILKKFGIFKTKRTNLYSDSNRINQVSFYKPNLFCVNSTPQDSEKTKAKVIKFFEKKYPVKSQFEK
jgi:hypothetical protein